MGDGTHVIRSPQPMPNGGRASEGPESRSRARRRRREGARRAAWVALGILGVLLVVAPQLLGGVFDWAVAITSVLAVVSLAVAAFATRKDTTAWPRRILVVACLAVVWTGVQSLPLPCGVVELVAPGS